ncbi:MAG: pur operon repressor [Bacillota bacterium]
MDKVRRSERITVMTKILTGQPGKLFSLGYFADLFQTAKSSISEDLALIKDALAEYNLGQLATVSGAAGGVRYHPWLGEKRVNSFLSDLAQELGTPERIMAGGYLYMSDLIFNPETARQIGEVFASVFRNIEPEYVVTVETKGIPLALMTAHMMSLPLVIIRSEGRVTEGPAVNINYVSGSTRRIRTMSLARRALPAGAKVLLIDDFMKGGGTARGVQDLMQEFQAQVVGTGVLVSTTEPAEKMVDNFIPLLKLKQIDERLRTVSLCPGI